MIEMVLGLLIGQVLLAVFGFQTPHESFVGGFWQLSGVLACLLTMRAPDVWQARRLKAKKSVGRNPKGIENV